MDTRKDALAQASAAPDIAPGVAQAPTWVRPALSCLGLDPQTGIVGLMRSRIGKPMTVGWCEVRGLGPGGSLRGPGVRIQSADMSIFISMRPVEGRTDWIKSAQDAPRVVESGFT